MRQNGILLMDAIISACQDRMAKYLENKYTRRRNHEPERNTRLGNLCTSGARDRHVRVWRISRGVEGCDAEGCRHLHGVHRHWLNRN